MITPLSPYPAAMVKAQKKRTMVIADLHIGWEMALSQKGIHVPTQTPKILEKLKTLISMHKPDDLLILGDVKHTIATAEFGEWHDIPDFFDNLRTQVKEISIIRGNHDGNLDPLLPENIKLLPATGVVLGDVGFFHGHQWPSLSLLGCRTLVMAHVHPMIAFRDPSGFRITRQVWVKADCNRTALARTLMHKHKLKVEKSPEETLMMRHRIKLRVEHLFIMPSFNDFLGGRPLNETRPRGGAKDEMIAGPVLRSNAVNMENAEVYLLDGTFLGTLRQLAAS